MRKMAFAFFPCACRLPAFQIIMSHAVSLTNIPTRSLAELSELAGRAVCLFLCRADARLGSLTTFMANRSIPEPSRRSQDTYKWR